MKNKCTTATLRNNIGDNKATANCGEINICMISLSSKQLKTIITDMLTGLF